MKTLGRYIIIFLPLLFILSYTAYPDNKKEEAIFGFNYLKFSSDFLVFIENDSVYVPLEEVLSFFKIFYTVDENQRFEGYVNNSDSSFVIDFKKKGILDISGKKFDLSDDLWFATDMQIYVRSDLFANVFKLSLRTYFNRLSISVLSNYELPIQRANRARQRQSSFSLQKNEEVDFPSISERSFTILNGGILDYSIGTTQSVKQQTYNFSGNLGLAVLGGEFQYNLYGRTYSDEFTYNQRMRWRYLIDNKWIESISIGNIQNIAFRNSGGRGYRKPTYMLRGVQITNENFQMPNVFTGYIIEDRVEPDWTVELYLSDQLYDIKKADVNGYYRFEIPITYGLTNIKVKIYGTKGEFISSEKVINIPSQLLQPGEIKYSISAGEDELTKVQMLDGTANVGVTSWLTTSMSANKIEASEEMTLTNQTSINLFNNLLLNLTATNDGIYEAGIKFPNSKFGNTEITYTSYDQSYNFSNQLSSLNITTSASNIFSLPISCSIYGTRNHYKNWNINTLYSNLNLYLFGLNISLRHNLNFKDEAGDIGEIFQSLSCNASYSIYQMPSLLSYLGRLSINGTATVKPENWEFQTISGGMQLQIDRNISLNANFNYYPISKLTNLKIGLNMNLSSLRSNTYADFYQGNNATYSADLNGSLEFDSQNLKFTFLNSMGSSNMYGKSSASVKFFVDKNNNKIYDKGDELIPEADFSVINTMVSKKNSGGYKILSNLIPGTKYNIRVNIESFPNNSIIPDKTEFSFIAEPYSYTAIEIPCHFGGMIEGNIQRITENGKINQGGLKVHIAGINIEFMESVNVFSDGSFYLNGIPIGDYEIFVDSLQLVILKSYSQPPEINFTIKSTSDGDYVGDLNFELYPIEGSSTPKPKKDLIAENNPTNSTKHSPSPRIGLNSNDDIGEQNDFTDNTVHVIPDNEEQAIKDSVNNLILDFTKLAELSLNEKSKDIGSPMKTEYTFTFKNIKNSYIDVSMQKEFDKIADFMLKNPKTRLVIVGHSCVFSSLQEHQNLSNLRATEARSYLVRKGVDYYRIMAAGKGALYPIADNKTEKGKVKNSRLELKIIN